MAGPYWAIIAWCWVVFWVYWTVSALRIHTQTQGVSGLHDPQHRAALCGLRARSGRPLQYRTAHDSLHVRRRLQFYRRDSVRGRGCCARHLVAAVLGSNWSGAVRITEGQRLVRTGPYRSCATRSTRASRSPCSGRRSSRTIDGLLGFALVVASLWQKGRMESVSSARNSETSTPLTSEK